MRNVQNWVSAAHLAAVAAHAGAEGPPVPMTPQLQLLAISPGNPLRTFPFARVIALAEGQRCRIDSPSWKLWTNDWTVLMRVATHEPPLASLAVISDPTARDFNSELQTFQPRTAIGRWTQVATGGTSDSELLTLSARQFLDSTDSGMHHVDCITRICPPLRVVGTWRARSLEDDIQELPTRSEVALMLIPASLLTEDKSGAAPPPMVTKGRTAAPRRR